ncbi:MAG: amidohydrolase family protein [Bryobacterales bacterium]|nr:amidohydrolase family protein [Bryobacterales bacterium]
MRRLVATLALCTGTLAAQAGLDLVIEGGRVMDPESGLDGVRNVGILAGRVVVLAEGQLEGRRVLDASGQVVAPGFIDLHQHGQSLENYAAQARDGITTSLELEIGVEDIEAWYRDRQAKALVNYGASISHPYSRQLAVLGHNPGLAGESLAAELTPEQMQVMLRRIERGLDQGAVAVGFGLAYTPGASKDEIEQVFRLAQRYGASCHVHMRTDHESLSNLLEVIELARTTGAQTHVVHLNSSARDRVGEYLAEIERAQAAGVDITTEAYPYNRGSTLIQSHLFNDWERYTDEELSQFIWVRTGERLSRETFPERRKVGGTIIVPPFYKESSVRRVIADPLAMIASDGMWLSGGRAHPRSFGTFSRVLGRYVREQRALSLMEALRKMTVMPARRLERRLPNMRNKGRLRPGADADIVVFDPQTVIDRGTYEDPARPPDGIRYVIVNGVLALDNGALAPIARPGRAVRAERMYPFAPGTTWGRPGQ